MTHETNYVQWARDAEADGEHARAAEFWRLAAKGSDASASLGSLLRAATYLAAAKRCESFAASITLPRQRTGRRTIRGEHARGIIVMEFSPPNLVTFRLKGKRKRFPTTLPALYDFALRVEARRLQDERAKARKARRLNKGAK